MEEFATNVMNLCSAFQPYAYLLAVVAALVLGIMFGIPSDKSHELAKKIAPWVILGIILVAGAPTIGKWLAEQITFTGATK